MLWKEKVEEMINDKETVEYKQWWYEEKIKEWHTFNTEKKWMIERMSDNSLHQYENMEF